MIDRSVIQSLTLGSLGSVARLKTPLRVVIASVVAMAMAGHGASFAESDHGPRDQLQQQLVQSRQNTRLLNVAERNFREGRPGDAFRAIQRILSESGDQFLTVNDTEKIKGQKQAALDLLRSESSLTIRAWITQFEDTAAAAATAALAQADYSSLAEVAAAYPLTKTAFDIHGFQIQQSVSRGQFHQAGVLLQRLEHDYTGVALPYDVTGAISQLRSIVQNSPGAKSDYADDHRITPYNSTMAQELGRPWPQAIWSWDESVWEVPAAARLLSGLNLPAVRPVLTRSAWLTKIIGEDVLHRSPQRLVCLSQKSGTVKWSVTTDTFDSTLLNGDNKALTLSDRSAWQPTSSAVNVLRAERLGTFSTDGQYVFFVDGFRLFDQQRPMLNSVSRFGQAEQSDTGFKGGRKLVAVRMTPSPEVAWVIDSRPAPGSFSYQIDRSDFRDSSTDSAASGKSVHWQVPPELVDHEFLAAPLIHAHKLYILSRHDNAIFVNCLTRALGRMLWQQTLIHTDDSDAVRQYLYRQNTVTDTVDMTASFCGVIGNSIVCSLNNGMMLSISEVDGQLEWATNLNDASREDGRFGRFSFSQRTMLSSSGSFHPILTSDRIVARSPYSQTLTCLNAADGHVLWRRPSKAVGPGSVDGSSDLYAVHGLDRHLVLVGERHVRAISVNDGIQVWATPIPETAGRAVCSDELCLVPLASGRIVALEAHSGSIRRFSDVFYSRYDNDWSGILTSDDGVLCVSTPTAVTAYPTASTFLQERVPSDDQSVSSQSSVTIATAQLLTETDDQALTSLLDPDTPLDDGLVADCLLELLANQHFRATTVGASEQQWPPQLARAVYERLGGLGLSPSQRLRLTVIRAAMSSLSGDDSKSLSTPLVSGAHGDSDTQEMITLVSGWHVRADVILNSLRNAEKHDSDTAVQLEFVASLNGAATKEAALLLLLQELNDNRTDADAVQKQLNDLRSRDIRSTDASVRRKVRTQKSATIVESFVRTINPHVASAVSTGLRGQCSVPSWYDDLLFMTPGVNGQAMAIIDMHDGVVSGRVDLPEGVRSTTVIPEGTTAPGMIPFEGGGMIGMISLLSDGGPRVLWQNRVEALADSILSTATVCPPGADYFVWASESQLHCHHPVTGRLLWNRNLIGDSTVRQLGRSRIVSCDSQCVVVVNPQATSCQVFSTQTGQHLHDCLLNVPADQTPLVYGRRVLYVDAHQRLRLFDVFTQQDAFDPRDPVKIVKGAQAVVLPDGRVATIGEDMELLVINCGEAEIEFRHRLSESDISPSFVGVKAFESNGRLFVLLRDLQYRDPGRTAAPLLRETRLEYGQLICFDRVTGDRLWDRRSQPAVMPPIYGDAGAPIVMWATEDHDRLFNRQIGGVFQQDEASRRVSQGPSIHLQIVDPETGRLIAERHGLDSSAILRCVYFADRNELKLETETSTITVTISEVSDQEIH